MNPNVDMSVILEALQRRSQGGGDMESMQQTPTTGALPTGGANTPTPAQPTPADLPMPNQNIAPALKATQAIGSNVDDETKNISKLLIAKLLKLF